MNNYNFHTSLSPTKDLENYFSSSSVNSSLTLSDDLGNSIICLQDAGLFLIELKVWKVDLSGFEKFYTREGKSSEQALNLFNVFQELSKRAEVRSILRVDSWLEGGDGSGVFDNASSGNKKDNKKAQQKKLKEPYREQRISDSDSCEEFIVQSRIRQAEFESRKLESNAQANQNQTIGTKVFLTIVTLAGVAVVISLLSVIGKLTSDHVEATPELVKEALNCYKKINTRHSQVGFMYLRPGNTNETIKSYVETEEQDLLAEMERIKKDISSMKNDKKIRKDRLSVGSYKCDPEGVIGRYAYRIESEQRKLDQERYVQTEIEINAALDNVLAGWKKKAVQHYVADGVGPRVDTFVMKDGSTVLCTTSFRNGIRAVSCNH